MNKKAEKLDRVYLLWHIYKLDKHNTSELFIGVFRKRLDAKKAVERLRKKKGFKDHPRGFQIFEHKIGTIGWSEGFVTVL
jgi:hypothetical protein